MGGQIFKNGCLGKKHQIPDAFISKLHKSIKSMYERHRYSTFKGMSEWEKYQRKYRQVDNYVKLNGLIGAEALRHHCWDLKLNNDATNCKPDKL